MSLQSSATACVGKDPRSIHGRHVQHLRMPARISRRRMVATAALKGVLCDLDGVIYRSGSASAIPGAAEALRYLRERDIPWLFVTNTNTTPRTGLAARLRSMGIPCSADDIVSPAKLAADWLRAHDAVPAALFVAPELEVEFEGLPLLPPSAESGAAAVVIGDMGLEWNYATINRAFRLVMDGEVRTEGTGQVATRPQCGGQDGQQGPQEEQPCTAEASAAATSGPLGAGHARRVATGPLTLISLGKGRYYKDSDGYSIDVGPFTAAIEYASDNKAVVLGKPDPLIFCLSAQSLGLKPDEVVMIGDDIRGDVGGAQAAGLAGVLVQTGKFREHDLHVGVTPDAVLPSIAEFPAWWEAQQQREEQQRRKQEQQQLLLMQGSVDADMQMAMFAAPRAATERRKPSLAAVHA